MPLIPAVKEEQENKRNKRAAEKHGHVVVDVAVIYAEVHFRLIAGDDPRAAQRRKHNGEKREAALKLRQQTAHEQPDRKQPDNIIRRKAQAQERLPPVLAESTVKEADEV